MTNTELIAAWLDEPALIKEEQPALIQNLSIKFPYFLPLHYLKAIRSFKYQDAPVSTLAELFPANRVLLVQLFEGAQAIKKEESYVERLDKTIEAPMPPPLFPDQELKTNFFHHDYFSGQGIEVDTEITTSKKVKELPELSNERDLMVVMPFSEWLRYLEERNRKAKEEEADKSALRALWQKQKLTAAIEEEEEEIPEDVFEMAVNSITSKEEIVSESMAAVYALQGKKVKALDMYKKLSLQNPEKSAYFAKKIEDLQKEIDI